MNIRELNALQKADVVFSIFILILVAIASTTGNIGRLDILGAFLVGMTFQKYVWSKTK